MIALVFLNACQLPFSNEKDIENIHFSEEKLNSYSWELVEATDINGLKITDLFLESNPNKPIILRFDSKSVEIKNLLCNLTSINIYFQNNRLYTAEEQNPMTAMGCPKHILDREIKIATLLEQQPILKLQQEGHQIKLIIETSQKDRLTLKGITKLSTS